MKKIYSNPNMEVILLNVSHSLLAGSEVGVGDPDSADKAEGRRGFMDFDED